ncbi:MAG: Hsp20 family protein [Deltaproteobacteria bacterium]|nr:Hsp20 family protein [Deltaproteobacteria bacterium]
MANITPRPSSFPTFFNENDPFRIMREMMRWEPLVGAPELRAAAFAPAFDIKETKDSFIFKADMPGVKEGDIEISHQGNQLVVKGKRDQEKEEKGETTYSYERSFGSFARSFALPEGVDGEHARAELKEGVLTIALPKKPEVQAKKIAISTGAANKA